MKRCDKLLQRKESNPSLLTDRLQELLTMSNQNTEKIQMDSCQLDLEL